MNIFFTLTLVGMGIGILGLIVYWIIFAGCYVLLWIGDFIDGN